MIKVSDLRQREVINVQNGKKLGLIRDIEFDLEQGRIRSIVVPGANKVLGLFGKNDDLVVPWHKIKKLGLDVILVDLNDHQDMSYEEY